jgi:hypothetical protein
MSRANNSNRLTPHDHSLQIVENYIDVMTIITNTNTQLIRQQNNIIRNMRNVIDDTYLQNDNERDTLESQPIPDTSASPAPSETPSTLHNPRPPAPQRQPNRRYNRMTRREVRNVFRERLERNRPPPPLRQRTQPRENRNRSPVQEANPLVPPSFQIPSVPTPNTGTGLFNRTNTNTRNNGNVLMSFETLFPINQNLTGRGATNSFFSNVPVFPSAEQIERATETHIFQAISEPRNTSCPITMEPFTANQIVLQIRHCGHIFNPTHLHSWFRSNVRCPVCRYDIRDYNTNTNTETNTSTDTTPSSTNPTQTTNNNDTNIENGFADILLQSLSNNISNQSNTNPTISSNGNSISWSHLIPRVGLAPLSLETTVDLVSGSPLQNEQQSTTTGDNNETPTNSENTTETQNEEQDNQDDLSQD